MSVSYGYFLTCTRLYTIGNNCLYTRRSTFHSCLCHFYWLDTDIDRVCAVLTKDYIFSTWNFQYHWNVTESNKYVCLLQNIGVSSSALFNYEALRLLFVHS